MEAGEEVPLRLVAPSRRGDSRRESRLSLVVPVGCRLLDNAESKTATGQTEDVSHGGTKVWLTERFSLFSRVELFMRIGEVNFQGQAQIVAAELHPVGERYRHSLQWLGLTQEAKTALLKLTKSLAERAKSPGHNP
ncbi:MAG: PilZ domain-containing protein [Candidatus Methylomirabilales bacterium]